MSDNEIKNYYGFKQIIDSIIEQENIQNPEIKIEELKLNGRNYLSEIYNLDIKGKKDNKDTELNLFIKTQVTVNQDTETISIDEAYDREVYLYKNIFKIYDKLQEEACIPEGERLKFAKFYETNDSRSLVMENLYKAGFDVFKKNEAITIEFAEIGVEYVAKMHAMSFVLEAKMPEYFEKVKKELIKIVLQMGKRKTLDFIKHQCETAMEVLKTEDAKNRFKDVVFEKVEAIPKYFKEDSIGIKCICHNDFNVNNLMCKFNDKGIVTEIIALDFQTSYYGHPLSDYFFFVLGATDKATRSTHMTSLKEHYYSSLEKFLKKFDLDAKEIYPRVTFDEDYDKLLVDVGLVKTLMVLGFVLAPEDDFPDMSKQSLAEIKPKTTKLFTERVNDLVQDVIDWGYL